MQRTDFTWLTVQELIYYRRFYIFVIVVDTRRNILRSYQILYGNMCIYDNL